MWLSTSLLSVLLSVGIGVGLMAVNAGVAECPVVVLSNEGASLKKAIQLQKDRKVFDLEVHPNYEVSFTLTPKKVVSGWANIFHITNNVGSGNYRAMGNRVPGVWFHSMTTKLHICTGCDGTANLCLNPPDSLPMGKKTRIIIKVEGGFFTVRFGGCTLDSWEVARVKCSVPSKGQPATVYMSNPWDSAANAVIEDFVYSFP